MADRYFSEIPISEGRVLLVGPEAHHLIHVMRAKPGTRVVLFDGSGAEFAARVERVDRAQVQLAVLSRHEPDRELPLELTLGVALPKG
ncbi:MAG: RNA methyltransferase PUA domain-containing protein, partial [Planctomycetota bacterium]